MDPLDREVLALRHFEQLSRAEIAVGDRRFPRPPRASGTSVPWNGSSRSWGSGPVDWRGCDHEREINRI